MERETMTFDVLIIGAGPAGLSTAIRLKQLDPSLNICILEKAAEVGGHILSGAVFEPRALNELLPDWQTAPIHTAVSDDQFLFLSQNNAYKLPTPKPMQNHGNYIISLGQLCRWLAEQAEALGIEIYPGFPAADFIQDENNQICGVLTGDFGRMKDGSPGSNYQAGMALHCQQLVLAEGCRGSMTEQIIQTYQLRHTPQSYAIGLKELWTIPKTHHQPGLVMHTVGWPLDQQSYGGSFLYHWGDAYVSVGFVIGLDYSNPYLSPFDELQRFKTHPKIKKHFEGGERIEYGARALNEGGLQGLPTLDFPGGMIVGCAAGFLNVPKIKGSHLAMKSGMIAAETIFQRLVKGKQQSYQEAIESSWVWSELKSVRNIRPAFKNLWFGLAYAAIDTYLLRGKAPWTFKLHADHLQLQPKENFKMIQYPKADGKLTFDKLSSVALSNVYHEEKQPCHLVLNDPQKAIAVNYVRFGSPERYYCPAGVYEILDEEEAPKLQINAQNCIHCKTCSIKDPTQNITWQVPEGGGGPNYSKL